MIGRVAKNGLVKSENVHGYEGLFNFPGCLERPLQRFFGALVRQAVGAALWKPTKELLPLFNELSTPALVSSYQSAFYPATLCRIVNVQPLRRKLIAEPPRQIMVSFRFGHSRRWFPQPAVKRSWSPLPYTTAGFRPRSVANYADSSSRSTSSTV